jgi:hypothetical protein
MKTSGFRGCYAPGTSSLTCGRLFFRSLLALTMLGVPAPLFAICGLDGVVYEQLRRVEDPEAVRALTRKVRLAGTCSVCHYALCGGPRNEFGSAVNVLLTLRDRENRVGQREVGRRLTDLLADPSRPDSPTFGELFRQGRFPAESFANGEPPPSAAPARGEEPVTPERARELVGRAEAECRFGVLQLSRTGEITTDTAAVLAEFRGEMLMLGLRSLSPETAAALARSRAEGLWLHSLTSLAPEAAEALAAARGQVILTGLTRLDSVPLAEKLAKRTGALSLPHLTSLTPEVAAALARTERSLTLAGLRDISPEVQERLAETVGSLSLPNLTTLDSPALAKKLAAVVVLLPQLESLTPEQAAGLFGVKGQQSFFGGVTLPLATMTPETVRAIVSTLSARVSLTLVGNKIPTDEVLRALLRSPLKVTLRDVEDLTSDQIRVVADSLAGSSPYGPLDLPRLSLPRLRKLESPLLAESLGESGGFRFPGVTSISPEAAAALGALPEKEYVGPERKKILGPSGSLSLPSLEELSPDAARLLFVKRWISVSVPELRDVSLETIRLLVRQSARVTLGIPALPPEFAAAFAESPTEMTFGGGAIAFPHVTDLSPEAARILVKSLNRGVEVRGGTVRTSRSPRLVFGGEQGRVAAGFPTLSPEVAGELARYEGILEIQGLGALPDESAAALASFPGPYLVLSGPFAQKLSAAAAQSLSEVPGVLQIPLRTLDSAPLAERFVRQINWTLNDLETVSREAAEALSGYRQFFDLRALTVLDSPAMARRFVEGVTTGSAVTLPALARLTPEAAEILAAGPKPLFLGLTVLDSPRAARALSGSRAAVTLPRLRAATPEVLAVLKEAASIETPPLGSLYVLSPDRVE